MSTNEEMVKGWIARQKELEPDFLSALNKLTGEFPKRCDHKCHLIGLNEWIEKCPVCHCHNPKFCTRISQQTNKDEK